MIEKLNLFNTEVIGAFALASNKFIILPYSVDSKIVQFFEERTRLNVIKLSLGGINSVGIMVAMNDNGIVLPYNADEEDICILKKEGLNVHLSKSKMNALGNMIVANNKVGFVSPKLSMATIKAAEDTLGVELIKTTIAGLTTIGSSLALNSKGFVCHPQTTETEFALVSSNTNLNGVRVTVNSGYPYVRSGIIYNDSFVFVGYKTTGIEMAEIERALKV
ncbi:hypothetical protein B9Q02_01215 [Candidatus Marsarchaeota G1 archaeon BE_D]|jgi:translation initiation factor eIF-6, putative|uniref:Translation initiation factor 6 n=1 Tax=Candidatus Marsarchaeota G1 archaeon BE_D TaxID=1978156 RepID=A0A2R6AKC4_9ARCH|nr:MAG: hypothetical protein B9Q02_01215 [Candidatus Marsarchaeota G1 archaeon BE_D]